MPVPKPKIGMTIPVAVDPALLDELGRVAEAKAEPKSTIMRAAMRAGLPIVEHGGRGELVVFDDELAADVGKVAEWHKLPRERVIREAVKKGLDAVNVIWGAQSVGESGQPPDPAMTEAYLLSEPRADPMRMELFAAARRERFWRGLLAALQAHPDGAKALEEIRGGDETLQMAVLRRTMPYLGPSGGAAGSSGGKLPEADAAPTTAKPKSARPRKK